MKKFIVLCVTGYVALLASCSSTDKIADMQRKIDAYQEYVDANEAMLDKYQDYYLDVMGESDEGCEFAAAERNLENVLNR